LLDDERLRALLSGHVEGRKKKDKRERERERERERKREIGQIRKADGRERTE